MKEKKRQSKVEIEHKRKREQYGYTHCSGRKPHALVRAELEAVNPDAVITPEDVWVKSHTQEGGSILLDAVPFAEKLKKAQDEIKEKQDAGLSVEEPCAMTKAFGPDSRGRVRSLGPISHTQINLYAPARHKLNELNAKEGGLGGMVEEIGGKVGVLFDGFVKLCHVVDEIKSAIPVSVGSNVPSTSRDVASHRCFCFTSIRFTCCDKFTCWEYCITSCDKFTC
ncbi:uncharacterized protein LOC113279789 [Papaver somniferum]|uniref:uncharacterized protein LOC113279789 n=1 Tax=Papaver somniferum TaxID=3469 RepID=UPI000E6FB9B7|nr:uncharacterized protein LOC113279789 [Papaver somniferum]XP_026384246.1 uncharacterized protein LOC113279789 [Papaver somniferum]